MTARKKTSKKASKKVVSRKSSTSKKASPKQASPKKTGSKKVNTGSSIPYLPQLIGFNAVTLAAAGSLYAIARVLFSKSNPASVPTTPMIPPLVPPAPKAPVVEDDSAPEVTWDAAHKTVQYIDGYHRAKASEVNKEAVNKSPTFLGNSIGTAFPFTTKDGTHYIAAIEEHTNGTAQNSAPHPHPGVSIYVADKNV